MTPVNSEGDSQMTTQAFPTGPAEAAEEVRSVHRTDEEAEAKRVADAMRVFKGLPQ